MTSSFSYTQMGTNNAIRYHRKSTEPCKLPPLEGATGGQSVVLDRFSTWTDPRIGHQGSLTKWDTMRQKHHRAQTSLPANLYRRPVVESQRYGWLNAEAAAAAPSQGGANKLWWAEVKRNEYKSSEMTKFVEVMSLTNRDFSLF